MDNEKLKREISKRWPDRSPEARAQLEYILQEAGLLAKPRKRRTQKPTETQPTTESTITNESR